MNKLTQAQSNENMSPLVEEYYALRLKVMRAESDLLSFINRVSIEFGDEAIEELIKASAKIHKTKRTLETL